MTIYHFMAIENPANLQIERLRIQMESKFREWERVGVAALEFNREMTKVFLDLAAIVATEALLEQAKCTKEGVKWM